MRRNHPKKHVLAVFFVCATLAVPAHAQSGPKDALGAVLDVLARGLSLVGEKTENILAPRFRAQRDSGISDFSDLERAPREFDRKYPFQASGVISASNMFGKISVDTWDDPVVQVKANITVGAESTELAEKIAESIEVRVTPAEGRLDIRTLLPDTREAGRVVIEVNYSLTVPRSANVICKNYFGDTSVYGVGGSVTIDSQFGDVDLRGIGGSVNVRARGEFRLEAYGLRGDSTFQLGRTQADFANISGPLKITNFMGSVVLREIARDADIDVTNEIGPIHVILGPNTDSDITATALFGEVQSSVPLDLRALGDLRVGRSANVESKRKLLLNASFDNVYIHQEGMEDKGDPRLSQGGENIENAAETEAIVASNAEVAINAIVGNVRVEGVDSDTMRVTATRHLRLESSANARAAVEALDLSVDKLNGRIEVWTRVRDDLAALGCLYYRVDLVIQCPRTAPLRVYAQNGATAVQGMGASVTVEQAEGSVTIEHAKGELDLTNHKGSIQVSECSGPVRLSTDHGDISTSLIYGKQTINCVEGKTTVDTPRGEVVARNRGGEIRIAALDGVGGNMDIATERGDVAIVLPPSADVTILTTAHGGDVNSAIPLTGTIEKGLRKFQGRLNAGKFTLAIETKDGDITIN